MYKIYIKSKEFLAWKIHKYFFIKKHKNLNNFFRNIILYT